MKTKQMLLCLTIFAFSNLASAAPNVKQAAQSSAIIQHLKWLGPLPPRKALRQISEQLSAANFQTVNGKMAELTRQDLLNFSCNKPRSVGPTPDMDAVDAYIDGLPESKTDGTILSRLFQAAGKGNWLARLQMYAQLAGRGATPEQAYLESKLMDWLIKNDIGGIYSYVGFQVEASGYFSDAPRQRATAFDVYAALHNGYPAQHKVGSQLVASDDAELVLVGTKMMDCANSSLPSYRRIFSGEADELKKARAIKDIEKSYAPLHWAVLRNDVDEATRLLKNRRQGINALTSDGRSPIELALRMKKPHPEMLAVLIDHGAKVRDHILVDSGLGGGVKTNLLGLVVGTGQSDLEVVRLLVNAGSEPFDPGDTLTISQMPFDDSMYAYEKGHRELFEYLLSTKKLDPRSSIAKSYLVESIGRWTVFARLREYGISPVGARDFLVKLGRSYDSLANGAGMIEELLQNYPELRQDIASTAGGRAVSKAVYDCHLQFANDLIDLGAPIESSPSPNPDSLLKTIVSRCGNSAEIQDETARENLISNRKLLVHRLAKSGLDFNVRERNCPAWTEFMCAPPKDDDFAKQLLELGADPYRFYLGGSSVLASLISSCRVELLSLALSKPPAGADVDMIEGLTDALGTARRTIEDEGSCAGFAATAAEKLILYGAKDE